MLTAHSRESAPVEHDLKDIKVDVTRQVIAALEASLGIPGRLAGAGPQTPLLGAIPELDSMAVVAVLTALEERFGLAIDDDEIDGSTFANVGTLVDLVERKLQAA
jgi:acyl carrier protein